MTDDIIDQLRETAGRLINGDMDDWGVSAGMLANAADEIEQLRSALVLFVSVCNTAKPTSIMSELSMACDVAKRTLPISSGNLGGA